MINIPSYVDDPNYRYQMPALQTRVEGSGNGIKTNIINLPAVAKALRIPPEYPLKFFGHELCSNTEKASNKKTGDIKMIVNGSFNTPVISQLLDKFIDKYILCPRCKLPEIFIQVTKKQMLRANCNACGKREYLDVIHKVATYIIKNPPKNMHEFVKQKKENKDKVEIQEPEEIEEIEEIMSLEKLTINSPEVQESIKRLCVMIQQQQEPAKVYEELRNIKISQAFDEDLKYIILLKVLYDNQLHKLCKNKYQLQILELCNDNKYSYKSLLIALAHYFKNNSGQDKNVSAVLKYLYDNEILSEKILIKWSDFRIKFKKNNQYNKLWMDQLQQHAKEFIEWLKQAESEEEEDSEEEQSEQSKNQNGQEEQKIELGKSTEQEKKQQQVLINQEIEKQKQQIENEKQKLQELFEQKQEAEKSEDKTGKVDLLAAKNQIEEEEFDLDDI